jgi:hypothetical protein
MRFDPWAAMSYGQNLEPVGLSAAVIADLLVLCGKYGEFRDFSHGYVNMEGDKAVEKDPIFDRAVRWS